jgi:hypothetical protein
LDVELPGDRTLQMAIESHTGVKSVSGSLDNFYLSGCFSNTQ